MSRSSESESRWGRSGEYRDVREWKQATFGDVERTWDPTRKDGFGGYASKRDWHKATFRNTPRRGSR